MDTTQIDYQIPLPDRRRPWRREEYDKAAEAGIFGASERLELIEGEIIQKAAHNTPHATSISLSVDAMRQVFPDGYYIRAQLPLAIGEWSEPEPDIAVVVGSIRDYEAQHPTTAVLAIKVSDTTLRVDRETKAALYSSAGIPDYWIINMNSRLVEVYRDPELLPDGNRYAYTSIVTLTEDASIAPVAAPECEILVEDLLPRRRA